MHHAKKVFTAEKTINRVKRLSTKMGENLCSRFIQQGINI
jgi:hypothetical protein